MRKSVDFQMQNNNQFKSSLAADRFHEDGDSKQNIDTSLNAGGVSIVNADLRNSVEDHMQANKYRY